MPRGMCQNIRIRPSAQSISKVEYEVASGQTIPNLGERHCEVWADGGANSLLMHFQIADVHRPLLSLSKAADMGFRSYLDSQGGWLEDMESGEWLPIQRKGDLYVMQLWVKASADEQQAAPQPPSSGAPFVGQR